MSVNADISNGEENTPASGLEKNTSNLCGNEKITSLTKWLHQPPKAYMGYRMKMKSFHNV